MSTWVNHSEDTPLSNCGRATGETILNQNGLSSMFRSRYLEMRAEVGMTRAAL